jgi:hypothetical protein
MRVWRFSAAVRSVLEIAFLAERLDCTVGLVFAAYAGLFPILDSIFSDEIIQMSLHFNVAVRQYMKSTEDNLFFIFKLRQLIQ